VKGPFAGGWDLTDSALPFAPHMFFFFPFHLPSSPLFPHCLLSLCSTRYCCCCCCCCCCSLLLHPFQHTPVDAAAPCCTRSNTYSTVATAASITISAFNSGIAMAPTASYRLLPLSLDCVYPFSFSTLSQIGLSQSSSFF